MCFLGVQYNLFELISLIEDLIWFLSVFRGCIFSQIQNLLISNFVDVNLDSKLLILKIVLILNDNNYENQIPLRTYYKL